MPVVPHTPVDTRLTQKMGSHNLLSKGETAMSARVDVESAGGSAMTFVPNRNAPQTEPDLEQMKNLRYH